MRSVTRILTALVMAIVAVGYATAATIHVPADQPSVQAAIDAASNGDTVLVAPGRYLTNANFRAKRIVLASNYLLSGDPADIKNTVLDGSTPIYPDTGSVLIMAGAQDTTAAIIGFTITGGTGTKWFDISDSKTYREGGGILLEFSWPRIMHNLIINNDASDATGCTSAGGGGIRAGFVTTYGRRAVITDNVFAFNKGRYGGAIVSFHCPTILRNNVLWQNTAIPDFGGGGLWMVQSNVDLNVIENNTVVGNITNLAGGGLRITGCDAEVRNNIIRGNTGSPAQISTANGTFTIEYNNVEGGYAGTGNTSDNPQFADSNLYLQAISPCVDSGNSISAYNDREDAGNPGHALFPSEGLVRNDKGATGGPWARLLPNFTATGFAQVTARIDYGTSSLGAVNSRFAVVAKAGFGPVRIDSVRCAHAPDTVLYGDPALPYTLGVAPGSDSVRLFWRPAQVGPFVDTARVYHGDSTVASPFLIELVGRGQGCCLNKRGNVDGDSQDKVNLVDLSSLINNLTGGPFVPPCKEEADINADAKTNLVDLSSLINFLTGGVFVPANCP